MPFCCGVGFCVVWLGFCFVFCIFNQYFCVFWLYLVCQLSLPQDHGYINLSSEAFSNSFSCSFNMTDKIILWDLVLPVKRDKILIFYNDDGCHTSPPPPAPLFYSASAHSIGIEHLFCVSHCVGCWGKMFLLF